ncbi:MAG TPA: sigma-70 family RNA polymerase sigma factor [Vicinamibacterales bacterium]|jgi:RNA polymerase sigma-70 factor (ECF subfamily)
MSTSDEELIAAVAAGDREAFAELYRRRRPDVYRFALHMTGAPAVAEDVAQEVFLAVIHDAGRYTPGRSGVAAWLIGIARNHALRRMTERRYEPLPADGREPAVVVDPGDAVAREQDVATLRAALVALPVVYREAVVLCDLQEFSYQDAAAAAGCAVGTIRSRLHRGRGLLAERLRNQRWTDSTARSNRISRTRFAG